MKVKASTLIESITAMVILAIAVAISITVFISILNGGKQNTELNTHQVIGNILADTKSHKKYFAEERKAGNITYLKKVIPVGEGRLLKISITAVDDNNVLIEQHHSFILADETD